MDGGDFRATDGLLERFGPDRVLDTPISESLFVGLGVGLAVRGFRPVVEYQFMGLSIRGSTNSRTAPTGCATAPALHERGVLVLPDFVANAGGVIFGAVQFAVGIQRDAFAAVDDRIRANTAALLERCHDVTLLQGAVALVSKRIDDSITLRPFD